MDFILKLMAIIALIPQVLGVIFFFLCIAMIMVHVFNNRKKTSSKVSSEGKNDARHKNKSTN